MIVQNDSTSSASADTTSAIVEYRRYRLRPGTRETLIELFDREFVETQEAVGMQVIGQFRDLDDEDAFVWFRGFADMDSRQNALRTFYTGPVWAAHREVANGTMINSDNVMLLRPASPSGNAFSNSTPRPEPGSDGSAPGLIVATTCYLAPKTEGAFSEFFERDVKPVLTQASAKVIAALVPERSPNTFPRLPVREGETVFVWLSGFPGVAAYEAHLAELARCETWTSTVFPEMERRTWRRNEVVRLVPTARSRLHG